MPSRPLGMRMGLARSSMPILFMGEGELAHWQSWKLQNQDHAENSHEPSFVRLRKNYLQSQVEGVHFRAYMEGVFADRVGIYKFAPESNSPEPNNFLWDSSTVQSSGVGRQNLINTTIQLLLRPGGDIIGLFNTLNPSSR